MINEQIRDKEIRLIGADGEQLGIVSTKEALKIAEEAGEVLLAAKNDENLVYESVDLIFHTLLILAYKGIDIDEVFEEFARRRK